MDLGSAQAGEVPWETVKSLGEQGTKFFHKQGASENYERNQWVFRRLLVWVRSQSSSEDTARRGNSQNFEAKTRVSSRLDCATERDPASHNQGLSGHDGICLSF